MGWVLIPGPGYISCNTCLFRFFAGEVDVIMYVCSLEGYRYPEILYVKVFKKHSYASEV